MTSQLIEGEDHCERLKVEIVSFRNDLEKTNEQINQYQNFDNSTKILNDILSSQISPLIKTSQGYDEQSSTNKVEGKEPISYVNQIKGPNININKENINQQHQKREIYNSSNN